MFELKARISIPCHLYPNEKEFWNQLSTNVTSLFSPFLSLQFVQAVAESGVDVRICIFYQKGVIRGFFPFQFRNRVSKWAKAAEPVGADMNDYFGLIAEPGFEISSAQLLKLADLNYLGFSHLDEPQLIHGLIAEQPRIGLRIRCKDTGFPLEELCSSNRKYLKDTERRARQLESEIGKIEFNLDVRHNRRQQLDNIIVQKRKQYRKTNTRDALRQSWKTNLLHRLSNSDFNTCRGILSTMTAGDKWIASHFGIIGNGVLQYWLPVYNTECAKYAPGRLLMHRIIQASRSASIHTIDRGEGDTPSKRELANEEHLFYRGIWRNKSFASLAMQGFDSLRWRLEA